MNNKLSVSAIQHGTVIDHIPSGQALQILHLLALPERGVQITIGLHLRSKKMQRKDLIKIENEILTADEANEIVVFAPQATINVIHNFDVQQKINTHLPAEMKKVFICPNLQCVSRAEPIESHFYIAETKNHIQLTCYYCEKIFARDQVKVKL